MAFIQGIAVMIFSTDEASSKAVVYAGVPDKIAKDNVAVKWLKAALEPLKGKGGGKGGLAQGQVSSLLHLSLYMPRPPTSSESTSLSTLKMASLVGLQGTDTAGLVKAMDIATEFAKLQLS